MTNPFGKKLNQLKFEDIQDFCAKGYPEGVELDYKKESPNSGKLSKLIAAFANTRGGYILIGVEENKVTGKPINWDGITNTAAALDAVDQAVMNISPLPVYSRHLSTEKAGKAFVVVEVHEGTSTPYYVFNDPIIWIRTGSLRKNIDYASPEMQAFLFDKKQKESKNLQHTLDRIDGIVTGSVRNMNSDILKMKASGDEVHEIKRNNEFEISISVFADSGVIEPPRPKELLKDKLIYQFNEFPYHNLQTIQDGLLYHSPANDFGEYRVDLILCNGSLNRTANYIPRSPNGTSTLELATPIFCLVDIIGSAARFYEYVNYVGAVTVAVQFKNMAELEILPIYQQMSSRNSKSLTTSYLWGIQTSTNTISDMGSFTELIYKLSEDIHSSFNYNGINKSMIENMLSNNGITEVLL